jgi:deoxycytidylate deaminase
MIDKVLLDEMSKFKTDYRPLPRVHRKHTSIKGMQRLEKDLIWHSSVPLDEVMVGDVLCVKESHSVATPKSHPRYFLVTNAPLTLNSADAKAEFKKHPFCNESFAKSHNYFPQILPNLEEIDLERTIEKHFVHPPEDLSNKLIDYCMRMSDSSICMKMKFGSLILAENGRISSAGYNNNYPSYHGKVCDPCLRVGVKSGTQLEKNRAIHAEQWSMISALNTGKDITHGLLFVAGHNPDGSVFVNDTFYCTFCSRLMDGTDMLGVVTYTSQGPKFRTKPKIIEESFSIILPENNILMR